jgi:ribosomal protein S18 acetylase RimI-like enzyme
MKQLTIEPIRPDEYQEASELLGSAFIRTPFTSKVMGGRSPKLEKKLQTGMRMMLEKKPGKVVVSKDNGRIVGVMRMAKWPDCQNSSPRGLEMVPMILVARGAALRLRKFRKIWGEHDPKKPHWHIDPIAVLPGMQGQGIGSQLLQYFCDHVDDRNLPAYLETDQEPNVRLYKRFGFEVVEIEPIFSMTNWFMWRPAKKE